MVILLPLLPLRIVIGGLALVAIATINSLAAWDWPPDEPLIPWRRRVVLLSKELVLITLWCLGFRITVRGRENIKTAERLRAVAVFNHVAWVDAFVLVWLMAPSGVSKDGNSRIPVISSAVRALQTVYIPYHKLSAKRPNTAAAAAAAANVSPADGAAPAAPVGSAGPDTRARSAGGCGGCGGVGGGGGTAAGDGASGNGARANPNSHVADRASSDGSCGSGGSSGNSTCTSDSDNGSGSSSSGGGGGGRTNVPVCNSIPGAPKSSADVGAPGRVTHGTDTTPPSSGPRSAVPAAPAAGGNAVASRVTEVLLRRVNHPSYCQPGGFPMVVMAPEGTTSNGRGLLTFRTGAFVLGRPVLPICLKYRWRGLNPAWTIGDERWHFLRLMCQFRNDLEVEILPPYKPSQDELKDCRLYASHVRRLMGSVLGVPLVAASHDEYLRLHRMGVGVSWDGRRVTVRGSGGGSSG